MANSKTAQKPKLVDIGDDIPAQYEATHSIFRKSVLSKGGDNTKTPYMADIEIDHENNELVTMDVSFEQTKGGFCQTVTLKLDGRSARDIAYQLLMQANSLEA